LRRQPKVAENIRVIEVDRFDVSPCGGTHCTRTKPTCAVRVVGLERYKGMMRVSFMAGAQGRSQVFSRARTIEEMAKAMSSSPEEVPASLEKLRAELKAARDESGALIDALALHAARTLAEGASPIISVVDGGQRMLRAVAEALTAKHNKDVILASPVDGGIAVLVMRAAGSSMDCGAILKKIAQAGGGKGGGKPDRAEGRLPSGADFIALASS
jgi:alanyl-tRNA synthetase